MTLEILNTRLQSRATVAWYAQPSKRKQVLGVVFPSTARVYLYRSYAYIWALAETLEEQLGIRLLDRCRHGAIIREPISCEECQQAATPQDSEW